MQCQQVASVVDRCSPSDASEAWETGGALGTNVYGNDLEIDSEGRDPTGVGRPGSSRPQLRFASTSAAAASAGEVSWVSVVPQWWPPCPVIRSHPMEAPNFHRSKGG